MSSYKDFPHDSVDGPFNHPLADALPRMGSSKRWTKDEPVRKSNYDYLKNKGGYKPVADPLLIYKSIRFLTRPPVDISLLEFDKLVVRANDILLKDLNDYKTFQEFELQDKVRGYYSTLRYLRYTDIELMPSNSPLCLGRPYKELMAIRDNDRLSRYAEAIKFGYHITGISGTQFMIPSYAYTVNRQVRYSSLSIEYPSIINIYISNIYIRVVQRTRAKELLVHTATLLLDKRYSRFYYFVQNLYKSKVRKENLSENSCSCLPGLCPTKAPLKHVKFKSSPFSTF